MATHIQLVNKVLRRLREDTVNNITDSDYAELIGELVSDSYDQVLDAHDWEGLKHRTTVLLVDGQSRYRLDAKVSGGGDVRNSDARTPTVDSELQFLDGMAQAWVYDNDADDDPNTVLVWTTPEQFNAMKALDRTNTEDDPVYFTIYREADATNGRRLYMELYPEPDASRVVELEFWTRPASLAVDGTTDDTVILIPDRPVFQLALMYAYNERGEEIGEPGNLAERRFIDALAAAIEKEIRPYERADRYDWRRD